jgi:hypothetical protein
MREMLNTRIPGWAIIWATLFTALIAGFVGHDVIRQSPEVIRVHSVTERVITRTVTPAPVIVIKREAAPTPKPAPSITVSNAPAVLLPDGVTQSGGGYIVDCNLAQCTSLIGAGPFGTSCGMTFAGKQFCN